MKTKFYSLLSSLLMVFSLSTLSAQNIISNGDFENWTAGQPDDWTTIESGITVSEETTLVQNGVTACNVLVTTATQGDTDFRQSVDVVAGTTYDVSLWVYQVDTTARVRMYVGNYLDYSDPLLQGEWQEITYTYEAVATETIEVGARFYDTDGFDTQSEIILDNYSMVAQVVLEPTVSILSPAEGETFPTGDISIEFSTQNFVVATAGNGDGHVHYYVDGNMTMYYSPDPIELTGLTEGSHEVILKLVDDAHADLVPSVADTVNFTVSLPIDVEDIATLRAGTEGDFYRLTGEAFVTFAQSFRNQKYIQDATGAILIDDNDGVVVEEYVIGDGMTNLVGELTSFAGVMQFKPLNDPGSPTSSGNVTEAQTVELSEFNTNFEDYESELVRFEEISFVDAGGSFENGTNYDISQDVESGVFRTHFWNVDYIGTEIPDMRHVTGIAMEYNGSTQVAARFLADFEEIASNDTCDTFLGGPWTNFNSQFGGAPVADENGDCPINEITSFEVWASESYTVDGFVTGETYTFSICNGAYGAWSAELSVWDENGDLVVFLQDTCSISWTATYDGTYIVGINEVGACGADSENTQVDNGFPSLTCEGTDAVNEIELANFSVFPNPNNGQFSILNDGISGVYFIEMMDVAGKVVYSQQLQLNAGEVTNINADELTSGVYLVKMTNIQENYYRTIRMVVK